jgi:hypothetical protein
MKYRRWFYVNDKLPDTLQTKLLFKRVLALVVELD